MNTLPNIFTVDKTIYNLARDLGMDTHSDVEVIAHCHPPEHLVYKVTCTQQEYILLKHMAEEL